MGWGLVRASGRTLGVKIGGIGVGTGKIIGTGGVADPGPCVRIRKWAWGTVMTDGSVAPPGLGDCGMVYPGLAPGAIFCRRSAAEEMASGVAEEADAGLHDSVAEGVGLGGGGFAAEVVEVGGAEAAAEGGDVEGDVGAPGVVQGAEEVAP